MDPPPSSPQPTWRPPSRPGCRARPGREPTAIARVARVLARSDGLRGRPRRPGCNRPVHLGAAARLRAERLYTRPPRHHAGPSVARPLSTDNLARRMPGGQRSLENGFISALCRTHPLRPDQRARRRRPRQPVDARRRRPSCASSRSFSSTRSPSRVPFSGSSSSLSPPGSTSPGSTAPRGRPSDRGGKARRPPRRRRHAVGLRSASGGRGA